MNKDQINGSLEKLNLKYQSMGQDLSAYLDGLLLSNYITYWDYINVDTLLTLQKPKTDFPDEEIFIMYHQITELYFKMCLNEMVQIANNGQIIGENGEDLGWHKALDVDFFIRRLNRINRYFETLTQSFDIMVDGMEKEQFQRFRMALLPASGFQSAQYRLIEFASTPLIQLVRKEKKNDCKDASIEEKYEHIYWKQGATEIETGQKTLTLEQFEKKYKNEFINWIKRFEQKNIYQKYLSMDQESKNNADLKEALRNFDMNVNVFWPLVHYKSAVRYLQEKNKDVAATGGTNWQQYLPPRFQKRIFFPELWSEKEKEEWGKGWVIKQIFGEE
ncbi:tryptophan 2,3-dioxygenase [Marivirga tractuosa]|uniref:Tryptophan 2,3-dioxygenase apoenzyme n=1 Tax=Marivirga tractuosa (strain ATCC 23168 / DSM 4126 / NBRC 15989 / NCIMB 1408 / VKM B-1430 / H-43) TaxID=643867 RepID=E4TKL2_MARTH|nr:tryptophan 2,3-dioxygenase family protein [Marivirga tractuosa]ADR21178.1 Tryptophan 2,3-dioxygenase apoenzyme [Marivirga tractuosa DSM 4126]BDD14369.1 tryptophan 2,3-dioxygenase [Marivirga tractuosa]